MSSTTRAWLQMHVCVALWGFTAILGKLIQIPAVSLVFWRSALVSLPLVLLAQSGSQVTRRLRAKYSCAV